MKYHIHIPPGSIEDEMSKKSLTFHQYVQQDNRFSLQRWTIITEMDNSGEVRAAQGSK